MKKTMSVKNIVNRAWECGSEFSRDFCLDRQPLVTLGSRALVLYWCYNYAFSVKWQTVALACAMYVVSAAGIAVGGLRYWTRRDFAAGRPLQCLLLFMFACAGQSSLVEFVRTHRSRSSPHQQDDEDETVDVSDLTSDPLLMFYERHVLLINALCSVILPACASAWLWAEAAAAAAAWLAARLLAGLLLPAGLWGPAPLLADI